MKTCNCLSIQLQLEKVVWGSSNATSRIYPVGVRSTVTALMCLYSQTISCFHDDLGEQFGVTNMPLTLLIDRNGKIADLHAGVVDKDSFESKIRSLLHENAAKQRTTGAST